MDDMFESIDGNALLGRRLEAYADARLSPDLTASSRLRARVLAVAHRRADLARADARLVVLPRTEPTAGPAAGTDERRSTRGVVTHRRRARWQRAAGVLLSASLGIGVAAGVAFAARPAGPLYDPRIWAETLTLPADPSARAVAELDRLDRRLGEAAVASRSDDAPGVAAALAAYESIVDEASASAILTGDDVAAAILETGVGRNLEVLRGLVSRVPSPAGAAMSRVIDQTIERSNDAVDRIGASRPAHGDDHGAGTGTGPGSGDSPPANVPTARPTKTPSAKPAVVPAATPTPRPKPTRDATPEPTAKPDPERPASPTPEDDQGKPGQPGPPKPGHDTGPGLQGG